MINFFVTRDNANTLGGFLEQWAPEIADRFEVVPYEELAERESLPAGVVLFTDLERVRSPELEVAREAAAQLEVSPLRPLVLNDPRRARRRGELLRLLAEQGVNDFNAYRLNELRAPVRFPVFLRFDCDHNGPLTPLLHSRADLERAVCSAAVWGLNLRHLLVVEYIDTVGPDGLYRKYGSFVFAGTVFARHLFHARQPTVKEPQYVDDATRAEAVAFLAENPHVEFLSRIAREAGVDYGRFDYAVLDGRPQIWELNTNPVIEWSPSQSRWRDPAQQARAAARMARLFVELDERGSAEGRLELRLDQPRRSRAARVRDPLFHHRGRVKKRVLKAAEPLARSLHGPLFPILVRRARSARP
jgi:hypothetical protein